MQTAAMMEPKVDLSLDISALVSLSQGRPGTTRAGASGKPEFQRARGKQSVLALAALD